MVRDSGRAPVVHIWFFKAMPSRLGTLLDMKTTSLEKIIYFQDYVVLDAGTTPLKYKQLLTEEEYRKARQEYGETSFKADMGAEAVRKLLMDLDLAGLSVRKQHPCGGDTWRVVRLGAEIGIRCLTCDRKVLLPRATFERRDVGFSRGQVAGLSLLRVEAGAGDPLTS